MAKKDRHIVLFVIDRFEFKDKDSGALTGKGFELRVVHVISEDQKSRGAGVEKVYFYEGGTKSIPKVLQRKDLNKVWEKKDEIKKFFDNPGPIPPLPLPEPLVGGELGGGGLGGTGLGGADLGGGLKKTDDF
jgi:hypothetical protein